MRFTMMTLLCRSCAIPEQDNNTPIHLAIYSGKDSVIDALFDYGADINCHGWVRASALGVSRALL